MEAGFDSDRAFWWGVLAAGGNTSIAGYHLTALTLMTADPDAQHERASLAPRRHRAPHEPSLEERSLIRWQTA